MNFQVIDLVQGSPEWRAHRARHFNASDAPAMMASSPNKSRSELVKELASGIERDFSDYVQQRVLDKGHTFEAYARPMAESIIGETLYPVVGTNGLYGASYDGLTILDNLGFEHKSLNAALREAMHEGCTGESLPLMYQVQMEQQCMVCPSIERVLFMASEWDYHGNLIEERHCWYYPNMALRQQLVTGWTLIEKEAAAYDPSAEAAPEVVGQAPDQLPALRIDVTGMVTASNLEGFKAVALRTIGNIKTTLTTDQDFADAEKTVKWCTTVESSLAAAKQHALSQTESIDRLFRTIDEISEQARAVRLKLEKLVKSEKEARKEQIVVQAQQSLDEHIHELNRELGANYLQRMTGVFAPVIKGLKSLDSMYDKVQAELTRQITDANAKRDSYQANRDHLEHSDGSWMTLFPDFATVGAKAAEDFQALAALRITNHKQQEQARQEALREQIRKEEAAKLQHEAQERERAEADREAQQQQAEADRINLLAADAAANDAQLTLDTAQPPIEEQLKPTPTFSGCAPKAINTEAKKCDGNHGLPRCADPGCWNDHEPLLTIEQRVEAGQTMTLGVINAHLGIFDVKATTLAALGITTEKYRGAVHMNAGDFERLCEALIDHICNARDHAILQAA